MMRARDWFNVGVGVLGWWVVACGGKRESVGELPPGGEAGAPSAPAYCGNDKRDGNESDIDCGGNCRPCPSGATCSRKADCESNVCLRRECQAPSCEDETLNGDESDIDCGGGGSCSRCPTGKFCNLGSDCLSRVCADGVCQAATCDDGVRNGAESDVDCGGSCSPCPYGKKCGQALDCESRVCEEGKCVSCLDEIKNGDETDVDCGGSVCAPCAYGSTCGTGADCVGLGSGCYVRAGGEPNTCVPAHCDDDIQNEDETDVDCGGTCSGCYSGYPCNSGTDCYSGVCNGRFCVKGCDADWLCGDPDGKCIDGACVDCTTAADCRGKNPQCVNGYCY
jgi:hypothetical protein